MNMRLPKFAQGPIETYLKTGNFKDHQKESVENDDEAQASKANFEQQLESFVATDNTKRDLDMNPGTIRSTDSFFGEFTGAYERSADNKTLDTFMLLGSEEEGAVIYGHNTPEGLDIITVTTSPSADEGVTHFSHTDMNGHFMTFAP